MSASPTDQEILTSIDEDALALECLQRKQLVSLAKRFGVKANGKNVELISRLASYARDQRKSDNDMSEQGDVEMTMTSITSDPVQSTSKQALKTEPGKLVDETMEETDPIPEKKRRRSSKPQEADQNEASSTAKLCNEEKEEAMEVLSPLRVGAFPERVIKPRPSRARRSANSAATLSPPPASPSAPVILATPFRNMPSFPVPIASPFPASPLPSAPGQQQLQQSTSSKSLVQPNPTSSPGIASKEQFSDAASKVLAELHKRLAAQGHAPIATSLSFASLGQGPSAAPSARSAAIAGAHGKGQKKDDTRFVGMHKQAFAKMDSIASHYSMKRIASSKSISGGLAGRSEAANSTEVVAAEKRQRVGSASSVARIVPRSASGKTIQLSTVKEQPRRSARLSGGGAPAASSSTTIVSSAANKAKGKMIGFASKVATTTGNMFRSKSLKNISKSTGTGSSVDASNPAASLENRKVLGPAPASVTNRNINAGGERSVSGGSLSSSSSSRTIAKKLPPIPTSASGRPRIQRDQLVERRRAAATEAASMAAAASAGSENKGAGDVSRQARASQVKADVERRTRASIAGTSAVSRKTRSSMPAGKNADLIAQAKASGARGDNHPRGATAAAGAAARRGGRAMGLASPRAAAKSRLARGSMPAPRSFAAVMGAPEAAAAPAASASVSTRSPPTTKSPAARTSLAQGDRKARSSVSRLQKQQQQKKGGPGMSGVRMTAAATARAAAIRERINKEAKAKPLPGGGAEKKLPAIPPRAQAAPELLLRRNDSVQALQV